MRPYIVVIVLLTVIFGGIALMLGYPFSNSGGAGYQPPPITVIAAEAQLEQRGQYLQAVGTLQAERGVELTSEASGQVTQVDFESGDAVEQGQLLLVLNDDVEQAARLNQLAALKLAELQHQRGEELVKKNTISQTEFDEFTSTLDQARAQLAETEARLANKRIKAPFTGTAGIREVDLGDYVSPGTLIVTLQDLTELKLDFAVPAQAVPLIKEGLPVEFQVSAYPAKRFKGEVIAINPKVNPNTRNLKVRARVSGQTGLLPGMFAEVEVTVGQTQSLVTVPETAVTYSLHGNSVYVIESGENGLSVRSQIVSTGEVRDSRVAILSGLESGDRVVTAGQNKLYPGAVVVVGPGTVSDAAADNDAIDTAK